MAPLHFSLVTVTSEEVLLTALQALSADERPYYVGRTHHWIHAPTLSAEALTSSGPTMHAWTHLIVAKPALTSSLSPHFTSRWTITAPVEDEALASLPAARAARAARPAPELPAGWSSSDASGLLTSEPPSDLEASLGLSAVPLGATKAAGPKPLKEFVQEFGRAHAGPVAMFNLLAYERGMRAQYMKYIAAFGESVGSRYGGEPVFAGFGVMEWSSRESEGAAAAEASMGGSGVWEDSALVYYPSLWHFAKMLDDDEYMRVDRAFKQGALKDNPLICCTEIEF